MPPNPRSIIEMASAFYESSILFSASDLGVFKTLAELDGADCDRLAEALKLNIRGTRLLLDACVAVGLLEKEEETYRNTKESSAFLVPGTPGDLSGAIRYNRDVYSAWGRLNELIHTGMPVEKPELHLGSDEDRTRTFVLSMHGRALAIGPALVPFLNLGGCRNLLDIGGGPGTFSVLVARAHPEINCTVLDLPEVVKIAEELISEQNLTGRVATLPGDYHSSEFPAGNDAVNILGVLHQEDPESIKDILSRAYDALVPGGTIHIMDLMTDKSHTAPKFSALFAVNMALTTENGWVFSDAELSEWLKQAGFSTITIQPLPPPMPHWLVTARKPEY